MTPIVHITPRETALERENERLTDKTERQSATIHVQAVAIQAMQADAERYQWLRRTQVQLSLSNDTIAGLVRSQRDIDAAMKETTS